jgi:tetratricopeptide (TPR) repeat protein
MRRSLRNGFVAVVLIGFGSVLFFTGCSRDPNVRKQRYFANGKRYFEESKYREAAFQFSNALHIDSNFAEAHYQLALCALKLGSAQDAYAELSLAVQLEPDNLQAQLDLGNLLLAARDFPHAKERADLVLSTDPNNVSAHILKANTEDGLGNLGQALMEMNTAVQIDPRRSMSYLNRGVLETRKIPNSTAAEADFKKAIELESKAIQPRLELAAFYDRNKRYGEAEQVLQNAIQLAPKDTQARAALVRHYLVQQQKESAEKTAHETKMLLANDPEGSQFLAQYYLAVKDQKDATAEYQQLAQRFPKERQIQHAYLELLMQQGKNDAALKQVDAILKSFPKDGEALADEGLLLLADGRASEARDLLQSVVKADSQNVVAVFALGNSFKALGDVGQAEIQWREATKLQPSYLPAQRALADLAVSKRDFNTLGQIAKTLQEKLPTAPDGYQLQAEVDAAENNDAKSAEQQLQKAISFNPKNPTFYVQLGQLEMAQHHDAEAEKTFDQALQIDPQQTPALRGLTELDVKRKQPQKAVKRAQDMVAQFPQNGPAHMLLGELAVSQKNLQLAESEFLRAQQLMPNDTAVYSKLESVQIARHEGSEAEATCQAAVRNNPKDPTAYWLLATAQQNDNKNQEAEKNYRKVMDLRPDFGLAANNLAYLLLQDGENIDQAITYAEMARRQLPSAPAVADTLGWAYYQKGMTALAISTLLDAVKGMPNSATYHYHLGMAYSKSGDRQHAKAEIQKAMQLELVDSNRDEMRKSLAALG